MTRIVVSKLIPLLLYSKMISCVQDSCPENTRGATEITGIPEFATFQGHWSDKLSVELYALCIMLVTEEFFIVAMCFT